MITVFDLYHEDFIQAPHKNLINLLEYLDVNYTKEYIEQCASIVYKTPNKSRWKIFWPEEYIELVEMEIEKYDFLKRYSFKE